MSALGQERTFGDTIRRSAVGGEADVIDRKADIDFRMSAFGGRADVVCQELSGPLLAKTGSAATRRIRTFSLLLLPGNTGPIDPGLQRVVKRLIAQRPFYRRVRRLHRYASLK